MERFTNVDLICEGALERSEIFATRDEAETFATNELAAYAAEAPGASVDIFLLDHEHEPEVDECSCAQYVTDGRPDFTNVAS